jgi:anti-anti-sigma factor
MSELIPPFGVATQHEGETAVVVSVSGDVDMHTAPAFEEELGHAVEDGLATALVVDLTDVTFIDSTGLNALVRAFERQRLAGSQLALVSDDSRVAMILEVARLDRVLKRYPTRAEALAAVEDGA